MSKKKLNIWCPYCKGKAELIDSAEVYGTSYGLIWICRPCEAWVGTHKTSPVNAPLGRLANKELRKWKQAAHACFDPLWKTKKMTRNQAYKWLAEKLNIHHRCCHIGYFDVDQCKAVVAIMEEERVHGR